MSTPILVTGSAGFIGFHLIGQLLAAGHSVVGYDNLDGFYPAEVKRRRLEQLAAAGDGYLGVTGDICDLVSRSL